MDGGAYLVGSAGVVAAAVALAHGAGAVRRAALPAWNGTRGALVQAVVALVVGLVVARAAGSVGLLTGAVVLAAEVGAGLLVGLVARRWARTHPAGTAGGSAGTTSGTTCGAAAGTDDQAPTAPPGEPAAVRRRRPVWEWALAIGPVTVVALQWLAHTGDAIGRGMVHPDTLWYHGPFAARFAQTHDLGSLDGVGYEAARWFPLDGQLVHSLGLLAYERDWLSPLVNLGWLALALLAAWCIGERRRAGPAALATASVVLGAPFLAATQPGQMSTDIGCAALLLAAVAILLESDLQPAPLLVAGAAVGLALGTKVTVALPVAVLVVAVTAVAFARRGVRPAAGWLVPAVVLGGFWFARDWVLAGSPLPWFSVPGLFERVTVDSQGESILAAGDLGATAWDTTYRPGLHQALGPAWPFVLLLVAVGATLVVRRSRPVVERVAGLVVLAGVVGHIATPLTGGISFGFNLRYLAPTFLVAAALVPLAVPPGGRGRAVVAASAAGLVVVGATAEHVERTEAWPGATPEAAAVLAAAALATAAAVVLVRRVPRVPVGAVVAAGLLVAVGAGWPAQAVHEDGRYVASGLPPTDAIPAAMREVRDERVVVFGTLETYPMFGPDLSNEVELGTAPPAGSGTECARWRAHLGGRYDVVVVSPWGFTLVPGPPPEVFAGDPAARVLVRDGEHAAYRLDGPLDPTRCPV